MGVLRPPERLRGASVRESQAPRVLRVPSVTFWISSSIFFNTCSVRLSLSSMALRLYWSAQGLLSSPLGLPRSGISPGTPIHEGPRPCSGPSRNAPRTPQARDLTPRPRLACRFPDQERGFRTETPLSTEHPTPPGAFYGPLRGRLSTHSQSAVPLRALPRIAGCSP